jgi:hypothetical protein
MPSATPCLFVGERWGDLLVNQGGIQAFLVDGGIETPLLNGGVNSWSTDEQGVICFNLGRELTDTESIKVLASYQNLPFEGVSTAKYPIVYLNNNPNYLVVQHIAPRPPGKENYAREDGLNVEFELAAQVRVSTRDVYGNNRDTDPLDYSIERELVDRVELVLDGQVMPLWTNIPDFMQDDPIAEGFYTAWTPTENRTYIFKPRAYLTDGTVLEDHKPLNIIIGSAAASARTSTLSSSPEQTRREKTIEVRPNPFTEEFTLTYVLPQEDEVSVLLQPMNGSLAQPLLTATRQAAGRQQLTLRSGSVASGVYLLMVRGKNGYLQQQRVVKIQ